MPTLRIRPRPEQLALHGIDAKEVMDAVSTIGGRQAGVVYEGRADFRLSFGCLKSGEITLTYCNSSRYQTGRATNTFRRTCGNNDGRNSAWH